MSDSLFLALAIGIAFGFTLERAGLGSARKLAGQFYLTDLTVFKVMFSAIVTAMLGAFWLGRLGVLDLSRVYVPETWLIPQVVGGLVFGVGFVIAGLCPGTSCVAAAAGRGDGAAVVGGMFAGVLLTGFFFPSLQSLYDSTSRGAQTLPQLLHVSYGVVVCAVVAIALAGFRAAEWLEKRGVVRASGAPPEARWKRASLAVLAVLTLFAGSPSAVKLDVSTLAAEIVREDDHVTAIELAQWIRGRKAGLRIFDLRTKEEFDEYHVPRAKHVAIDALVSMRFTPADTIVLVSDGGAHAAQAWVLLRASGTANVYFLRGGLGEWLDDVMNPVGASAEVAALSRYFGGLPRSGDASAPTTTANTVKAMKRRGC